MLDTGSPDTILNKDLEPELGERLGISVMEWVQGLKTNGVYQAPKLYLGDTLLRTDDVVRTSDFATLGMDTLRHHCVQLDFNSHKIRFLDPNHLDTKDLGEAFPLSITGNGHVVVHTRFLGLSDWVVDTGNPFDAALSPQKFEQALRGQQVVPVAVAEDEIEPYCGACLSQATLGGYTYSDLYVSDFLGAHIPKMIGVTFLARNLVTFNFPKRVMYLKQVTAESPILGELLTKQADTFLRSLAEKGELPGWTKGKDNLHWKTDSEDSPAYPASRIFTFQTSGQGGAPTNTCHYSVVRESRDSPWILQRAWRSDASERIVEEYPLKTSLRVSPAPER